MATSFVLGMEKELLLASSVEGSWQVKSCLNGLQITCLAADPFSPERLYCGTFRRGLWRSEDGGASWQPIGDAGEVFSSAKEKGILYPDITSVAVSSTERNGSYGVVYAGTEPSALFRSDDGGDSWHELKSLRSLPSAPDWHFPPRPYTNHVRWIALDPLKKGRVFAAIEAGALVRSADGGISWEDRQPDGPIDTHTLVMHHLSPDRLYSAAGDGFGSPGRGYNESRDGGTSWLRPDEGLHHHYLWSLAVDPADPETIVVSASSSPQKAHNPGDAAATLYRKTAGHPWQECTKGLPDPHATVIPIVATHSTEPGVFYMLSNKGFYRSGDSGESWQQLPLPWKQHYYRQHQQALLIVDM